MTSGKRPHQRKEEEGVDGRLTFALHCALYLQVIVLLGHLPIELAVVASFGFPLLHGLFDLMSHQVPPTDEDVDKIMGKGYSEWRRKDDERERRRKDGR